MKSNQSNFKNLFFKLKKKKNNKTYIHRCKERKKEENKKERNEEERKQHKHEISCHFEINALN